MNAFNRIVVILGLVLTILCSVLTVVGMAIYQGRAVDLLRMVTNAYPPEKPLDPEEWIGLIVIAIISSIFAFIVLWFEVIPGAAPGVRLAQVSGSQAILTTDAIVQRVKYDAEQIANVRQAKPRVRTNGKEVDVRLELRLAPGIDVPPLVEEVGRAVREGVESKMGVRIRRLNVFVKNEPFGKSAPAVQSPPRDSLL